MISFLLSETMIAGTEICSLLVWQMRLKAVLICVIVETC